MPTLVRRRSPAAWIAGGIVLLGLPVVWLARSAYHDEREREMRQRFEVELQPYGKALENALNRRLALIEGFRAFVEGEGGQRDFHPSFEVFAFGLQSSAAGIRALQVIEGGVIRHVFPKEGNEQNLGFELGRHPESSLAEGARRAEAERRTVVLGPFTSEAGEPRLTVIRPYAAPPGEPAGLVALLLDMEPIAREAGLDGATELRVALRAEGGLHLFGDSTVLAESPVDYAVPLPDGALHLVAVPARGWQTAEPEHERLVFAAGTVFVGLLALLGWLIATRQSSLAAAVDERTHSLSAAYEELQRQIAVRERIEAQLLQSQKMEGIGRLAGGIAHDFNNLLTAILGYTALIRMGLRPGDAVADDVAEVEKAARRAADLTRQLLAFARKQVVTPRVVSLNELVGNLQRLLDRLIGPHVMLETELAPDLWAVRADAGQLEQVVTNLVVNARDALPRGGTIRLVTRNVTLRADTGAAYTDLPAGDYVRLDVADTGEGMDEATLARVFEPFFTTKEKGKGTGLGLATAYGIVRQAGGSISVSSRPGEGSTFTVLLPQVDEPPGRVEPTPTAVPSAGGEGTETVLVVDDEALVRDIAVRALRARGYRVLVAGDGLEARGVADAAEALALLVADVQMPGLDGRELAATLRATRPGLRVLFISGRAEAGAAVDAVPPAGTDFLPKPFTPSQLALAVRALLDRASGA
ncbi:MAG TPA: ATP-binding protein [Gemmatimonadales bacterium]|nr:ATP-binding protein [Gemmatimonadales bacterium]